MMKLHLVRRGAAAPVLAAAALAAATFGAGSAQATLLAPCTGASTIHGEGAWVQRAAQSIWNGQFNVNTNGCSVTPPAPTYTSTSSGQFMNGKWDADGAHAFDTTVHFGGTDDAPTTSQITNINSNLGGASVLSIPVAQTAIAIVVNPPAGCSISSISPADLELVFRGSTTTWAGIAGTSGCGTNRITRVARADSSGTTYQLKHYLFAQNLANVCSSRTATWADLQTPANNTVWPSVCDGPPSTGVTYSLAGGVGPAAGSGGGDEARTVANTTGSIGYVALPDARNAYTGAGSYKWLTIRPTARGAGINPSTNGLSTTRANANCTTTSGSYGTSLPSATASWAGVYLTNAGVGYPLCTLTWDLAVTDYSRTWGVSGQRIATTVHDYLRYVNVTGGGVADALTSANDYQAVPNGTGAGDVQAAAATGIGQITGLLSPCTGASTIHGEGSSLQRAAQGIWVVQFNRNANGCAAGLPSATYTATSSGQFMDNKWDADGAHTFDTTVHFGGTDAPPTSTQITNINSNLGGASVLSIPVAQTAIAIIANPPSGCSISAISPADLEVVFRGSVTTWDRISSATGAGCAGAAITRVVRADSAGTTYQLKHYLDSQLAPGLNICSSRTASWADLQSPANTLVWPSVCDGPPSTGVTYSLAGGVGPGAGSGEADEAKTVVATSGSIGYASLAAARAQYTGTGNYEWLSIRPTARGAGIDPSTNGLSTVRANANCTTATGAYGTSLPSATSTWSGVYLTTAGAGYPLCTLTWDLAVTDYSRTWGASGQAIATTVHDYLRYINVTGGGVADALTSANDYQALPNGAGAGDVQAAAASAVGGITD